MSYLAFIRTNFGHRGVRIPFIVFFVVFNFEDVPGKAAHALLEMTEGGSNVTKHNTNTPAPWSQLALPNASTDQPLYAHRDSINIQSTAPSQLFRKLRHRCTASPAVPPSACDLQHPALLFPSRAAFALARASPTAAHWDMYRRTPTTQTTLLG